MFMKKYLFLAMMALGVVNSNAKKFEVVNSVDTVDVS